MFDHLAAHGTGLAAGQVAVVALLQIDAHLLWCVFTTKIVFFFEVYTHQGMLFLTS